jgi:hypothetical protein
MWSPDGSEIFFEREGRLYAVRVVRDGRLDIGAPVELPISNFVQGTGGGSTTPRLTEGSS